MCYIEIQNIKYTCVANTVLNKIFQIHDQPLSGARSLSATVLTTGPLFIPFGDLTILSHLIPLFDCSIECL